MGTEVNALLTFQCPFSPIVLSSPPPILHRNWIDKIFTFQNGHNFHLLSENSEA